ncbi:circadian clock protein KaiC [Desulfobacterales bacterium HSG17]|nr:circadian clock protein KaiC [Desulfobacterales bacterium HSG17]
MTDQQNKISLAKISSGIAGLDEILEGGFPVGRTTIINGGHGSGKSLISLEFLYRNALKGKAGIYITFEEKALRVRQNAMTLGWDLQVLENQGNLYLLDIFMNPETAISGNFNLKGMLAMIEGLTNQMDAKQIVLDGIDSLLRFFNDTQRERSELENLGAWLNERELTAIITAKKSESLKQTENYDYLDFMADCVIHADQRIDEQINTRRIRISKYRGSNFGNNEYPFVITEDGIGIIPVSKSGLNFMETGQYISSGQPGFDEILGGGYRRGSCVLIAGGSGAGKSIIAATFTRHICMAGEKTLYVSLEEARDSFIANMLSPGIDLNPALKNGSMKFISNIPESMGAEEHLFNLNKHIETFKPDHFILDAISACARMGTAQVGFDFLIRLAGICKRKGITCIYTSQTDISSGLSNMSGNDISSLVDSMILLNMAEIRGEINRTMLVFKSRGMKHSNQYREYCITDNGIQLLEVYVGKGGVLTGTERQEQEIKEETERRRMKKELERKKSELAMKKTALAASTSALNAEMDVLRVELETMKMEGDLWEKSRSLRAKIRGQEMMIQSPEDVMQAKSENTAAGLESFLETVNAPVFCLNRELCFTQWSQSMEQITDYAEDEVIGKNLDDFIPAKANESVIDVLENTINGIETSASFRLLLNSKNGETAALLLNSSARRNNEGKITGAICVGQDITNLQNRNEEIR